MKKNLSLFFLALFLPVCQIIGDNYEGYTLYATQNGNKAYLIDNTGATYHIWTFNSSQSTCYSTYLLANGVILRTVNHSGNYFNGGPVSGEVQKVDWNSNVTWDFVYSTSTYCSHHDVHAMPNGNVLLICYEKKTAAEAIAAGCSQSIEMWPEKIVEVQPSGTTGGTIVWEWHVWDHLVQQYDATKNNYGVVANHPELMNINYNTSTDWMHANGIDFNPTLDQITFSSHNMNEVYVIDHSTTTAQAATHAGGNSGKGGDFLYRWGNPAAYGASGTANFNVVHDAHWVPYDNPSYPNSLCGFNNKGGTGNKSCVDIFTPPYNGYNYSLTTGQAYLPTTYNWRTTYSGAATNDMGNSQQFPNGNTLICIAQSGFIYEINSSQTQVWSKSVGGVIPKAFRYPPCFVYGGTFTATATATPSTICSGSAAQLNVTGAGSTVYNYSWTSSPAGFTSILQSPTVSPAVTTTYTATIKNGPCTATANVVVTVNNPAVSASAATTQLCLGSSTQLFAAPSGGTTYTYSWTSVPAGFTSALQNPMVSPTTTTTYTVVVTSNGCTASSNVLVHVNPVPAVSTTATPAQISSGGTSQLAATATGGSGFSYSWTSVPAGFTSNLQNPVVSPSATTTYYLSVMNSNNCEGTSSVVVSVNSQKTLNVHLFLEGLYTGSSFMSQASDESGSRFGTGVSDQVTIELHNSSVYSEIVYSSGLVEISTAGYVVLSNIPGNLTGFYYITVKHRNSIETTSSVPVSFAGTAITYSFNSKSKAYGENLILMNDGTPAFFTGDENQDMLVDSGDMAEIGNLAAYAILGYLPQDINGDGLVDSSDLAMTGNNAGYAIGSILPE